MNIIEYLNQTWIIVTAGIAAITLLWNFIHKTLKEIHNSVTEPFTKLNKKIDDLQEQLNNASKNDQIVQRALLTLQRASLLETCELYIKKGFATLNEKETVDAEFRSYSELGGNSFVSDMVADVMNLPIEKKNTKKKR